MTYLACFRMWAAILSRRKRVQLACFSICALSWWVVIGAFIDKVAQLSSTHIPFCIFFFTFLSLLIETNSKTQNFLFDYCNFLCNAAKLRDAGEAEVVADGSTWWSAKTEWFLLITDTGSLWSEDTEPQSTLQHALTVCVVVKPRTTLYGHRRSAAFTFPHTHT